MTLVHLYAFKCIHVDSNSDMPIAAHLRQRPDRVKENMQRMFIENTINKSLKWTKSKEQSKNLNPIAIRQHGEATSSPKLDLTITLNAMEKHTFKETVPTISVKSAAPNVEPFRIANVIVFFVACGA